MSEYSPYSKALEILGLGPVHTDAELKSAYRRAVWSAPPDRDPAGFERVRAAQQLLAQPLDRGTAWLLDAYPHLPPLPDSSAEQPGLAFAALSMFCQEQSIDALVPQWDLDAIDASSKTGDS